MSETSNSSLANTLGHKSLIIKKAAVIGAGAMGSGIAAQLANAGVSVYLLDIVPQAILESGGDRDTVAKSAIQRMLKAVPASDPLNAGLMIPANAKLITPGNTEDHLAEAVADADWVVEVVIENLDIKRALFEKLETLCKPDAVISSNTSTIPLADLVVGRSESFQSRFMITHFFNPPRFMHLLEIVGSPLCDPSLVQQMQTFGDQRLGKNVLICKDTPGFLANRIGIYYMFRAITETLNSDIGIEEADALLGTPIGFPKEGIFALLDLVGIGIIPLVTQSLLKTLAPDDAFRKFEHPQGLALVNTLLKDGRTGRNGPKGGFYRMQKNADGSKSRQAFRLSGALPDPHTGEAAKDLDTAFYTVEKQKFDCLRAAKKHGPRALFEYAFQPVPSPDTRTLAEKHEAEMARFAWVVVRDTLLYAATLVPEIADDIADIDAALRGGYNAKGGPFEIIDSIGIDWFCHRVRQDGISLPPTLILAMNRSFYREFHGERQRLVFDFHKSTATYAALPARAGVLSLETIKRKRKPLVTHFSASLWDIGDGVTCLEFHSKMNTLDPSTLWVLNQSLQWMSMHPDRFKAMVIYNEGAQFSLGANLGLIQAGFTARRQPWAKSLNVAGLITQGTLGVTEALIYQGQRLFNAIREAPFPVVGAPHGMALGGGCEILLHCDAIQAGAETYMGLVESGVGLIPGWGGCSRALERATAAAEHSGPIPPVRQAFQTILMPQLSVSNSAEDARLKLWLRPGDGVTMNPDRLLADAKAKALSLVSGYQPPPLKQFKLPGESGRAALNMALDDFYTKGDATWHDIVVGDALATVLCGGDRAFAGATISGNELAQLEREQFLSLIATNQSQKRIAHTLKTGKPLRETDDSPEPTLLSLRRTRKIRKLEPRSIHGGPFFGLAALQLQIMAEATALIMKKLAP